MVTLLWSSYGWSLSRPHDAMSYARSRWILIYNFNEFFFFYLLITPPKECFTAWLQVFHGKNKVRTAMETKPTTSIGKDEQTRRPQLTHSLPTRHREFFTACHGVCSHAIIDPCPRKLQMSNGWNSLLKRRIKDWACAPPTHRWERSLPRTTYWSVAGGIREPASLMRNERPLQASFNIMIERHFEAPLFT